MSYLHEILQTISHNKLRTALTGLAVSWGIFMLIVLLGMSNGLVNAFEHNVGATTSNNIMVGGGMTTKAHGGYAEGRVIQLRQDDPEASRHRAAANIRDTYATISNSDATVSTPTEFVSGGYQGVTPQAQGAERLTMSYGRFINPLDITRSRKVMVISSRTASRLFPGVDNPVGRNVTCMGLTFKIVGVYDHRWREQNYIPLSTARILAGNSNDIESFTATLRDVDTEEQGQRVERSIVETLAEEHNFDPDDTGALWTWNQFTQRQQIAANMSLLGSITWIIGILTLLSGVIGVSNIMFVSVRERTHEIGVRRAIGARPHNILIQVILEGIAITAIFGYIGIILGIALLQLLTALFGGLDAFPTPSIDLTIAFEVTVVLIISGALAGLFPALKAIKVKPVEALRYE